MMDLTRIARDHARDLGKLKPGWTISCHTRHIDGEGTYYLATLRSEDAEITAGETQLYLAVEHVLDICRGEK